MRATARNASTSSPASRGAAASARSLFAGPALRIAKAASHLFAIAIVAWLLSGAVVAAGKVPAAAAGQLPAWATAKPESRLLILSLDAGVGDDNGGLNYNGQYEGSHRIVVPLGWTVIVRMRNADSRVAHSTLVTREYRQNEMPDRLGPEDAVFPGASTPVPFTGTAAGGYAEFTFVANRAGRYFLACGVHTHLQSGMWLPLDIVDGVKAPQWLTS